MKYRHFAAALAFVFILGHSTRPAQSQDSSILKSTAPPSKVSTTAASKAPSGIRRALLICGLAGDEEHAKLFGDSLNLLHQGLTTYQGFQPDNIQLLWGQTPTDKDPPAIQSNRGIANLETITQAVEVLRRELQPDDALWVIVMGHTHFDGRHSWLNLPGPDLNHIEFSRLFIGMTCQEQVFFITTPSSGYFLKPLGQRGRVVISATEADLEVNETLYPHRLAQAIGKPPEFADLEMDRDGKPTLLDLYLFTARETAKEYASGGLLATEHSLLEDNGDGRGTELQRDFLPEELGGRPRKPNAPPPTLKGDGLRARQIPIALPPAPDSPAPPELPTSD